jgi:membrane protein insertase Oxa1/YidC/SpoIIIJ
MELEEMKSNWDEMSKRIEKQEILNNHLIEKMTHQKYKSKLEKIGNSEYIGSLTCYLAATYLIINFTKIEEFIFQLLCIITILLLFTLPIISLKSLRGMKNISIHTAKYSETIKTFMHRKMKFYKLQRINMILAFLLLIILLPVLASIYGKDINSITNFWTIIVPVFIAFFASFSFITWRYYSKILKNLEKELRDL